MRTQRLGNSDLEITRMGLGAWAIGGSGWAFSWGDQDDRDSVAAIHDALDAGANWIDTAAVYGLGHSEEVVAQALEGMASRPYVFTKCERTWNDKREIVKSLKADSIRRECEASLKRLRVDAIDLYQVHWPEPEEDVEEGWAALARLKEEGKVRWIGLSNFNVPQLKRAQAVAPVTSLQPPYSLVNRGIKAETLPYCAAENVGVIVYSPMASGLLSGAMTRERVSQLPQNDWRVRGKNFQEPLLTRNLQLVEILKQIAARRGCTPGEIAIAWALHHPAVTAAIVGARRPGQFSQLTQGAELELDNAEIEQFESFLAEHPE